MAEAASNDKKPHITKDKNKPYSGPGWFCGNTRYVKLCPYNGTKIPDATERWDGAPWNCHQTPPTDPTDTEKVKKYKEYVANHAFCEACANFPEKNCPATHCSHIRKKRMNPNQTPQVIPRKYLPPPV